MYLLLCLLRYCPVCFVGRLREKKNSYTYIINIIILDTNIRWAMCNFYVYIYLCILPGVFTILRKIWQFL